VGTSLNHWERSVHNFLSQHFDFHHVQSRPQLIDGMSPAILARRSIDAFNY
jgi:hypothetical protein